MTVCSDMLELILGPINLVNPPKDTAVRLVAEETIDTKEDESSQSDVAIACTAMSCRIEDTKDSKKANDSALKRTSIAAEGTHGKGTT